MLVDPVKPAYVVAEDFIYEAIRSTITPTLPYPTATATASVGPIPPIIDVPTYEVIGKMGMVTLWVVTALMFLSTLAFIGMAWRVPVEKRLFHVITAFITTFAFISYFAMATGGGSTLKHIVKHEHQPAIDHTHDEHIYREVLWARYADWSLTTPLLLLDLAFLAGCNGADILIIVVADLVMVITGLFAALASNSKTEVWGYYIIAWLGYLVLVWKLYIGGKQNAAARSPRTAKFFGALAGFTLVLWTLYPIVWAFGDGTRKLSVDQEVLAYAILDVLAKPVFGFWLLISHAKSDDVLSLTDGFWNKGLGRAGAIRLEDDEA